MGLSTERWSYFNNLVSGVFNVTKLKLIINRNVHFIIYVHFRSDEMKMCLSIKCLFLVKRTKQSCVNKLRYTPFYCP